MASGELAIVPKNCTEAEACAATVATAIVFLWTSRPTKMVVSVMIRSSCLGLGLASARQPPLRSSALFDTSGRVTHQATRVPSGHDGLGKGRKAMKTSKFTDAQKAFTIRQGEHRTPTEEICRKAGISQALLQLEEESRNGLCLSVWSIDASRCAAPSRIILGRFVWHARHCGRSACSWSKRSVCLRAPAAP